MNALLIYSLALLVASLISDLANRTILSTAVVFLVVGFGAGVVGWLSPDPNQPAVHFFSRLAVISLLFTDGMLTGIHELIQAWRLPGRALLFAMPLTCAGTAALAHWIVGIDWMAAFLVGAVLSPTDPVFAAALIGNKQVPLALRRLLNVESGLNDGLALPAILLLLGALGAKEARVLVILEQLGLGVVIGIVIPIVAVLLARIRLFATSELYKPLFPVGILLLVWSTSLLTHANEFLAAFAAGATLASVSRPMRDIFKKFGEPASELIKLGALLLFGALVTLKVLSEIGWGGYVFAILTLVLVRPIAMLLSLLGSRMPWSQRLVAGWFGPKGFDSVVYGLLVLGSGLPDREYIFHLVGLVVAFSIVAHSSTDVLAASWLQSQSPVDRQEITDQRITRAGA
jgi:NhaP-type Na+/H+ or K+/H+ antiporter